MQRAFWHTDFEFHRDHLRVKKTGARVPYRLSTLREFLAWYGFYLGVQAHRAAAAFAPRRRWRLAFAPDTPRPWYLVWAVARLSGARFVGLEDEPDAVMFFEDATNSDAAAGAGPVRARALNFACADVSKSRVARVFEDVFGYPLRVDPRVWAGPAVEKSEANGAHDGRVVACPREPRLDRVYQRVVDNSDDGAIVEDLRAPTVNGRAPIVFIKRRPVDRRFENANASVSLVETDSVLTTAEQDKIQAFCTAMGLQWGGLDILRDRNDGRIYIVDVNKTDMGPPTALALRDQVRAARRLAQAFRKAFAPARNPRSPHGR